MFYSQNVTQVFTNMNKDMNRNFEHIYHLPTEDKLQEVELLTKEGSGQKLITTCKKKKMELKYMKRCL